MSLKIWIGSEYDNSHENAMAGEAIARLSKTYSDLDEECDVLNNLRAYGDLLRWITDHSGFCENQAEELF